MDKNPYQVDLHNKSFRKRKRKIFRLRNIGIAVGALVLSTVVIQATDGVDTASDLLLGNAVSSTQQGPCPFGMVVVKSSEGDFCIDQYEASPNAHCDIKNPVNQNETRINLDTDLCAAESKDGVQPWKHVARHQAEQACARAGKRLPSNKEWYLASLGTPDSDATTCHISSGSSASSETTGARERCVSGSDAYDMIGNVWEWVDATIFDGELDSRSLPEEGYVAGIDTDGVPIETGSSSDPNFNADYFWIESEGIRGMVRGGYFGSGSDAGQYTINAITPPSFSGKGVGFRCAI